MSIKNRVISGLLTFIMILGMIPTMSVSEAISDLVGASTTVEATESLPNVHVIAVAQNEVDATAKREAVRTYTGNSSLVAAAEGVSTYWYVEGWHYSGGYWGGSLPRKVYDWEFKKTQGGVANVEESFNVGKQKFTYTIKKGSDLHSAIEAGDEVYINVSPNKDQKSYGIKLDNLFNIEATKNDLTKESEYVMDENGNIKGMDISITKNKTGDYIVTLEAELKLNYWDENVLGFNKTYGLNLLKFIPIVKEGYGQVLFSMWCPSYHMGAASMWYDASNPYSMEGMPEGYIHPTMIRPYNARDAWGSRTSSNHGGLMYENVPLYEVPELKDLSVAELEDMTWKKALDYVDKYGPQQSTQKRVHITVQNKSSKYFNTTTSFKTTDYNIGKGTFASAGAVGIRFTYNIALDFYVKPKTKVIASYVQLVGMESDGMPIFETALESKLLEDVDMEGDFVYLDNTTAVVDEHGSSFKGVLNDVVTSHKDLGEPSKIDWSEDYTPEGEAEKINQDAVDIDYYKFGIITGTDLIQNISRSYDKELYLKEATNKMKEVTEGKLENLAPTTPKKAQSMGMNVATAGSTAASNFKTLEDVDEKIQSLDGIWYRGSASNSYTENRNQYWYNTKYGNTSTVVASEVTGTIVDSRNEHTVLNRNALNTQSLPKTGVDGTSAGGYVSGAEPEGYIVAYTENYAVELTNPYIVPTTALPARTLYYEATKRGLINVSGMPIEYIEAELNNNTVTAENEENVEENIVYVRYIVYPEVMQRNKINIYVEDELKEVNEMVIPDLELTVNDDFTLNAEFVDITDIILDEYKNAEINFIKWILSDEPVVNLKTEGLPTKGSQSGTSMPDIVRDIELDEDIFAEWDVIIKDPGEQMISDVPEWRLSKFTSEFDDWKVAIMNLSMRGDAGCYASDSYITPSGDYAYYVINPNGQRAIVANTPENQKYMKWVHSKGLTRGSYSVTHDKPFAIVEVNASTNYIKATEDSKLVAAKWLEDANSVATLQKYDINSDFVSPGSLGKDQYTKTASLLVNLENKHTYTHYYGYRSHHGFPCYCCKCGLRPETATPSYSPAEYKVGVTFDRYNSDNGTLLSVSSDYNNTNGFTTIKYQLDETLKVYPEYGMLFANDNGDETIKWVVGDKAREIKPVVWQTLEHKVYVKPMSTGSSVATDTRALTQSRSIGESGKQIIYKGAAVNSTFQLYQSENSNKVGLLTVKTYTLDFNDNGLMASVKSSWGNSAYNSYDEHKSLLSNIKDGENSKATATEKLLVDIPYGGNVEFTGAVKTQKTSPYKIIKYSNGTNIEVVPGSNGEAVVFEHELIIRGGYLIGVKYNDRNGNLKPMTMLELKETDEAFYNALIGMNLYDEGNNKNNTVLKGFEHQKGDKLTESLYASLMVNARNGKDGISTPSYAAINMNEGWYSEDTTVLVIKEYVSNFEVPSISISDKLPMTISGTNELNTPANKAEFFSKMGKGYLYLKYNLDIKVPEISKIEDGKVDAYFEYTSFPTDITDIKGYSLTGSSIEYLISQAQRFGAQGTNYLVPNVSITDTTRMN